MEAGLGRLPAARRVWAQLPAPESSLASNELCHLGKVPHLLMGLRGPIPGSWVLGRFSRTQVIPGGHCDGLGHTEKQPHLARQESLRGGTCWPEKLLSPLRTHSELLVWSTAGPMLRERSLDRQGSSSQRCVQGSAGLPGPSLFCIPVDFATELADVAIIIINSDKK